MEINKELRRIIEYQNSILPRHEMRSKQAVEDIVAKVSTAYSKSSFDFQKFNSRLLDQDGKKRRVMMYEPFSPEEILCIYLKRILDRRFHIQYPNRNSFMRSLFNTVSALKDMSDYTIVKFDFKDFFNSVSSTYVYQKYIQGISFERYQSELLEKFVFATRYAYAGLSTSNIICEIIAKHFDDLLIQRLSQRGFILYKRYIDDGILIFNRYISQTECFTIITDTIRSVFHDPGYKGIALCKTTLNNGKTNYIARRLLTPGSPARSFDFLGYEFTLTITTNNKSEKTAFTYGITQKKRDKYFQRLEKIVRNYDSSSSKDLELLRHQIKAFTHRTVYQISRYKNIIWKNKGFIANYSELRYHMDELTASTEAFLKNGVFDAFTKNGINLPYFLKADQANSIYSLYNNLNRYRTLLFVELIGIDKKVLEKMCSQIGIDVNNGKDYDGLVRDYLIKVKVGH